VPRRSQRFAALLPVLSMPRAQQRRVLPRSA